MKNHHHKKNQLAKKTRSLFLLLLSVLTIAPTMGLAIPMDRAKPEFTNSRENSSESNGTSQTRRTSNNTSLQQRRNWSNSTQLIESTETDSSQNTSSSDSSQNTSPSKLENPTRRQWAPFLYHPKLSTISTKPNIGRNSSLSTDPEGGTINPAESLSTDQDEGEESLTSSSYLEFPNRGAEIKVLRAQLAALSPDKKEEWHSHLLETYIKMLQEEIGFSDDPVDSIASDCPETFSHINELNNHISELLEDIKLLSEHNKSKIKQAFDVNISDFESDNETNNDQDVEKIIQECDTEDEHEEVNQPLIESQVSFDAQYPEVWLSGDNDEKFKYEFVNPEALFPDLFNQNKKPTNEGGSGYFSYKSTEQQTRLKKAFNYVNSFGEQAQVRLKTLKLMWENYSQNNQRLRKENLELQLEWCFRKKRSELNINSSEVTEEEMLSDAIDKRLAEKEPDHLATLAVLSLVMFGTTFFLLEPNLKQPSSPPALVKVGSPGNLCDPHIYPCYLGSVNYEFEIEPTKVTKQAYVDRLNSVTSQEALSLYNKNMGSFIKKVGGLLSCKYELINSKQSEEEMSCVSYHNAQAYCRLMEEAQNKKEDLVESIKAGAYKASPHATYRIMSNDEYQKATYYDPEELSGHGAYQEHPSNYYLKEIPGNSIAEWTSTIDPSSGKIIVRGNNLPNSFETADPDEAREDLGFRIVRFIAPSSSNQAMTQKDREVEEDLKQAQDSSKSEEEKNLWLFAADSIQKSKEQISSSDLMRGYEQAASLAIEALRVLALVNQGQQYEGTMWSYAAECKKETLDSLIKGGEEGNGNALRYDQGVQYFIKAAVAYGAGYKDQGRELWIKGYEAIP
jgi:hypothetical protein